MKGIFSTTTLGQINTPFYYYDTALLKATLNTVKHEADEHKYIVHYAIKANANPKILQIVQQAGLGADCVSGGEIQAALAAGFPANRIVYAGVGKNDWEINLGLDHNIYCFNVESLAELEIINELAALKNTTANVCIRVNPNIEAHTHANITTGLAENKFGIDIGQVSSVLKQAKDLSCVHVIGLHFHIGSQISDMSVFATLCSRINELQDELEKIGFQAQHINVGGGLGIDYKHPDDIPIADFKAFFNTYTTHLKRQNNQQVHFELGRSIVAQCGSLITKTLYIKQGVNKQFAIVDGGMNDLIRPALYQAYHKIENISSEEACEPYDVVGPICESTDVFGKAVLLNKTYRGDLIAIRSAGAYGESMASQYNCRPLAKGYFTEDL